MKQKRTGFVGHFYLSTSFEWESMGPYLSTVTVYHTFDLINNKEISLLNEIDPARLSVLKKQTENDDPEKPEIDPAFPGGKNNSLVSVFRVISVKE